MIVFEVIRYKNLLGTGNAFIEIPLNKNSTTLITGLNGAGKTTILEAICFALYGVGFRDVNKPNLVNAINERELLVEIEFSIGNRQYKVCRGIKPTVFDIFVNGKLIDQTAAARDYQEMLETTILKMNQSAFCQIVMLSVVNYVPFMKLKAAARREVIENLLDIQIFSVMNTLLKERVSTNKAALLENEHDIKLTQSKIDMHRAHLVELQESNTNLIQQRKAKIKGYATEIKAAVDEARTDQGTVRTLQEKLTKEADVKAKHDKAASIHGQLLVRRRSLTSDIAFYMESSHCPTCKQGIDSEFKAAAIDEKRLRLTEIETALSDLERRQTNLGSILGKYASIRESIAALEQKISDLTVKISTANNLIIGLRAEIAELETRNTEVTQDNGLSATLNTELATLNSTREALTKNREVLSMAAQLLKDGGIKSRIIKQYIPVMNKLINKYMAAFDFFVQFEIDEEFKETIKSRFRDKFTYESFSAGEQRRIDLALIFTWRAIAKLRNNAATNLLIMDEILDSSLDGDGVDKFIGIIKTLTEGTNTFIITHKDQLIDKFDNVIRLEKHRNFSRIAA